MQIVTDDAARMDRHYRFQRHIYDATRTHYLIGRRPMLARLNPQPGQSVLEIACGTAWNLVRAARLYPEARFFGVDVSNAMLTTARQSIARQGLAERICLAQADATRLDTGRAFGIAAFDRVFISYALSMIPDWRRALAAAERAVAPNGALHIVDFGQCEHLPLLFKHGLDRFLAHYSVMPRANLEAELSRIAETNGLDLTFERLHRGYTVVAKLCRLPET
jgi:S-adenosylmethionine-diacylgycerolhomoserine-N-methlytransferase